MRPFIARSVHRSTSLRSSPLTSCFTTRSESPSDAKPDVVSLRSYVGMYAELSKARLSSLVVVTAGAGYLAGCSQPDPVTLACLFGGTTLCAFSANSSNQIIERERDKLMKRTCDRPLPSGRLSLREAVGWGIFSGVSGGSLLLAGTNPTVALLGVSNIALYAGPYTLSKPHSEWNTWVGAAVGAVPPLMGYCAAGGDIFDTTAGLLASTLFLCVYLFFWWQFPHFYALAYMHRKDYARGGHEMVPVNDPTGERTARLILGYSVALFPIPILATTLDVTSSMFLVEGVAATGYLTVLAEKFRRERTNENARDIFRCSLWYLPLLLGLFVFHRKREGEEESSGRLHDAKAMLKRLCVHEAVVSDQGKSLCPQQSAVTTASPKPPV